MDRDLPQNKNKKLGEPSIKSIALKATEDYDSGWDLGYTGPPAQTKDSENMIFTRLSGVTLMTANEPMTKEEKLEPRENTNRYGSQPTRKILA